MSTKITEPTIDLPIQRPPHFDEMVVTAKTQVAAAQKNPAIGSKPAISASVDQVQADAVDLETKLAAWRNALKLAKALEGDVAESALTLVRDHGALEAILNQDCAGDEQAMLKWGAKKTTRTPATPTTAAPTNVRAGASKKDQGAVVARCKAESNVICYLFQMGSDPTSPQSWPAPEIEGAASHEVSGLTSGQKVYFRVAIVRRGTGQGLWSDIVGVTVK
jgi:hypothetical protein